jgi:hypothetical protein
VNRLVGVVLALVAAAVGYGAIHHPTDTTPAPAGVGAPTALTRLHVDPGTPGTDYRRARFGSTWADLDRDGCNTREEVMARDLVDTTRVDGCNVIAGLLHDPYTGRDLRYAEAQPTTVQIDHVVPLAYAWRHGAATWDDTRRRAFANDPANLLAVDGRANAAKGDSGPGEWMPVNRAFACGYARRFTQAAYAYRLTITAADKEALRLAFTTC